MLAAITGAHGVTGEVRLKIFAKDLASLKKYKKFNDGALTLKKIRPHKIGAVARFEEITDRNMAEAARSTQLLVPHEELPELSEDEFYYKDLIGAPCVSDTGEPLGKCIGVENFGAGDIIEIQRENGKKFMVPMNKDSVLEFPNPIIISSIFIDI
ncbi:16S rRNA processing protein RimM [Sphingorhabdus lutea]|uniref:Ribosome maturation factor RimM n=1 Tax=Sphingorhabdus lutea TaxID=1913578 RepID=A0A1L3JCA1_9SPHN|nr:16S rRNA processing protein RimM [Sphingorhabdus lutea]